MFVWSRAGILVPVIAFGAGALGAVAGGTHPVTGSGLGMMAGAVAIWFLGKRLNGPGSTRVLIDPQTNEQVILQRKHTMFWIPMEYWGVFFALMGVFIAIYGLFVGPQQPVTG